MLSEDSSIDDNQFNYIKFDFEENEPEEIII